MFTRENWRNNIAEILEVVRLVFVACYYLCNDALLNVVWNLETFVSTNKNVWIVCFNYFVNPLKPNDPYRGRTATLTSKRCILYIYLTNIGTEYFKHCVYSPFFPLQNAVCFIILTYLVPVLFTFYICTIYVLKLKKNNSGAKRLTYQTWRCHCCGIYFCLLLMFQNIKFKARNIKKARRNLPKIIRTRV